MRGYVELVDQIGQGAFLTADAPTGATTLLVTQGEQFAAEGCSAVLGGGTYLVTDVESGAYEDDPDVVHLATALSVDVEAGEPVRVTPGTDYTTATVVLAADGAVLEGVEIRQDLQSKSELQPGAYDGDARPIVDVELVDDQHVISNVDGRGQDDGSNIKPGTIPEAPTAAPETSPDLTVTGTAEALIIEAETVDPSVLIEYHVSTDPAFVPTLGDEATLAAPATRATVQVIARLGGQPLNPAATYYVRSIATNAAGTAAPSAPQTGRLDATMVANIVVAKVVAGFILTGRVQVGNITISADGGIVIPQPNGMQPIILPADGTIAQFGGIVQALALVVLDALSLRGDNNTFEAGSTVTLAAGVTPPKNAPNVERFWPSQPIASAATRTDAFAAKRNTAHTPAGFLTAGNIFNRGSTQSTILGRVWLHDLSGNITATIDLGAGVSPYSVCELGDAIVAFSRRSVRLNTGAFSTSWWISKLTWNSATGQYADQETSTRTWEPMYTVDGAPSMASAGSNLLISYVTLNSSNVPRLVVEVVDEFGVAITSFQSPNNAVPVGDLLGSVVASINNVARLVIIGERWMRVFDLNGTRQTAQEWILAGSEFPSGIAHDGTRFLHMETGTIFSYSNLLGTTNRVVDYSWYDDDPAGTGRHETNRGPARTFSQVLRSYMRINTDAPNDTGETDAPNAVRIWVGGQRQPDLATGATSAVIEIPTTGTTSKEQGFESANLGAALVRPELPGWLLEGNGNIEVGAPTKATSPTNKEFVERGVVTDFSRFFRTTNLPVPDATDTYLNPNDSATSSGSWTKAASGPFGFTCQVPGVYTFVVSARWPSNPNGRRFLGWELNGTVQVDAADMVPAGSYVARQQVVFTERFTAGQVVTLRVFHTAGTTLNITGQRVTITRGGA